MAGWRSGGDATSRARSTQSPPRGRPPIFAGRWSTTRSCGSCSTRCRPARWTRSRPFPRSCPGCSGSTPTAMPAPAEIDRARERLEGVARMTPVFRSETFSRLTGREVHLKAENLQRTGSFKIRGAVNKLAGLGEAERAAGVIAASAGNHGQAVAWAARELGIAATVYMPQDAPMAKVDATRNYGAHTVLAGAMFDDALAAATARAEETGATFV